MDLTEAKSQIVIPEANNSYKTKKRSAALITAQEELELVSNQLNLAKNLRDYYRVKVFDAEVARLERPKSTRRRNKAAKAHQQLDDITREYARIDHDWDMVHKDYRKKVSRSETDKMSWYHG